MKKWEKRGKKYFFPLFLFYLKETQMMHICKISFRFLKKSRQESKMYQIGQSYHRTTRTFYQNYPDLLLVQLEPFTRTTRTFYENQSDLLLEPLGPFTRTTRTFTRITRTFYQNYSNQFTRTTRTFHQNYSDILLELLEHFIRTTRKCYQNYSDLLKIEPQGCILYIITFAPIKI